MIYHRGAIGIEEKEGFEFPFFEFIELGVGILVQQAGGILAVLLPCLLYTSRCV